jgi:plastocyanin
MRFYLKAACGLLLAAAFGVSLRTEAGNIRGHVDVILVGPAIATNQVGATNVPVLARTNAAPYRDFVVYIEGAVSTNFPLPFKAVNIQIRRNAREEAIFSPHILPVVVGTSVAWRNDDSVYHQLFSLAEDATFEFPPCAPGGVAAAWKFDKPGRVQVFCSLYANLNGIVLVLDNPWFSGTDFRNDYFIQSVPAGSYRLTLWHERLPAQSQQITVPKTGEIRADFSLKLPTN